jgi:hypothetical protein
MNEVTIVLIILFFGTLFTRIPVMVVLGISAIGAIIFSGGAYPLAVVPSRMFHGINSNQ